jgi:hypothetical protein
LSGNLLAKPAMNANYLNLSGVKSKNKLSCAVDLLRRKQVNN